MRSRNRQTRSSLVLVFITAFSCFLLALVLATAGGANPEAYALALDATTTTPTSQTDYGQPEIIIMPTELVPTANNAIMPPGVPLATNPVAPVGQIQNTVDATSSTVLLFDVSGSMADQDVSGITKLDAAKGAGARILDIIEAENAAGQGAEVGILSFSEGAWEDARLSIDVNAARNALRNLSTHSGTGMADGLRLAIDEFQKTQANKPIMILLSDGMPNIGLGGSQLSDNVQIRQQVLDLAKEAGGKSICIYTVGFGVPNTTGSVSGDASIDENFLKQVSANSGCGTYYNAQNATDLANVYVNLRHASLGTVLLQKTGDIGQGQTVDIGATSVSQGTGEMLFTLNWPGSKLIPSLSDPTGRTVDQNYPGATFFQTKSLASVIIKNPMAGNWTFKAYGAEVPEGILKYNAVASIRSVGGVAPQSSASFPAVLVVVPLLIGGLLTYVFVNSAKRGQRYARAERAARLYVTAGEGAGREIPLRDNTIIGRSRVCSIYLSDPAVSRRHARIRFSSGQWFIQDMGSSSGTYLNGAQVNASRLNPGDHIRIGATDFQFHA